MGGAWTRIGGRWPCEGRFRAVWGSIWGPFWVHFETDIVLEARSIDLVVEALVSQVDLVSGLDLAINLCSFIRSDAGSLA